MLKLALVSHSGGRSAPQGPKAGIAQERACKKRTTGIEDRPTVIFARAPT